jgi:drug/metabolite transporter (DMT)-like permease
VSNYWIVVCLSLLAALVFAMSTSLKHISAGRVPDAQNMHPRSLIRFIRATVAHRLWLAGIACDVVGVTLQIFALHLGALSIVQPLLLTSLIFALVIRGYVEHRHISRRQAIWAFVLTFTLGCFVLLAATPGSAVDEAADRLPAAIAGGVGAVLVLACLVLGRRMRNGGWTAAILGTAVGVIYAATAALIKATTDIGVRNPLDLLSCWQLYTVVGVGALGLVLSQLTFQAGPLTASLPATATVDPLLSIVIGVVVYDERIRQGFGTNLLLAALLGLLGTAVVQLIRSSHRSAARA